MSPDVIRAKLFHLEQVLSDLQPHISKSKKQMLLHKYEIERQVQLCVDLCLALGRRWLLISGHDVPETGREVFMTLGENRLISVALSKKLANSVGLRNILVHEYDDIDYNILFAGLKPGFKAFKDFSKIINSKI